MENPNPIVCKARFNPVIRPYIVLYVAFFLLISIIGIPLMIIWICGVGQWYARHYFEKLSCELSDRDLRFRKGILFQLEKTIPLENIQDLTFFEGPLLRYFNLSVLKIETAGKGDAHGNMMSLVGIDDAHHFRNMVMQQRDILLEKKNNTSQVAIMEEMKEEIKKISSMLEQHLAKK